MLRLTTIISGGQTGADRGGLRAAIACGLEHGGWCPRGRKSEDGMIPPIYKLIEDSTSDYKSRTWLNVRAADSTLIFGHGDLTGGSKLTVDFCEQLNKPFLEVQLDMGRPERVAQAHVEAFLLDVNPRVLNVAGSRESKVPNIEITVETVLSYVLGVLLK